MYMYLLFYAVSFIPHFLHICNVAVPDEFPMVNISEPTIGSGRAQFILMTNSPVFTVTNDNLDLSGGDGMCEIEGPSSQLLDLTCNYTSAGIYDLTVDLSDGDNCLEILTSFNALSVTPSPTAGSSGVSPV